MLPSHLRALLKRVSRSFYLSVRVLPQPVQAQVAVGYLLARAADTIADTPLIAAAARPGLLALLRDAVSDSTGVAEKARRELENRLNLDAGSATMSEAERGERALLAALGECLVCFDGLAEIDRGLVEKVLEKLIFGMERDLFRFPKVAKPGETIAPAAVTALSTQAELDEYTYYAAGCVGEFWTDLMAAHIPPLKPLAEPGLRQRGVALGKALQMVNVIRDAKNDLGAGRCYWPRELLAAHGLSPSRLAELFLPETKRSEKDEAALIKVTSALLDAADSLCATARPYVNAIPQREIRLRLACAWPLMLAHDTLRAIRAEKTPSRLVKIPRRQVYSMLLRSSTAAIFDSRFGSQRLDGLLG